MTPAEQARADVPRGIEWAAGLFEGEGCATTGVCGTGQKEIRARIHMTDEEPIRWFHAIVGVGTVRLYHSPWHRKIGRKPVWTWAASTQQARDVLVRLYPYLSPRRQRRIDALLSGDLRPAREQEVA